MKDNDFLRGVPKAPARPVRFADLPVTQADFDRVAAERDALQQRLTAADERADVLETALRELLSGTGSSPGANKKYGKARAVLEGLGKKAESRICSPADPHNYHLGECTKCGAISPTE